jgi:very-short-patch-repair endonuclease
MPKKARSSLEAALDEVLKQLYPEHSIRHDFPIKVNRATLFVDRVILALRLAFEIDGRQHSEFVAHFHVNAEGFKSHKTRDRLKEQWLEENGFTLIRIAPDEIITAKSIRSRIIEALKDG